jgi:hypothetical protein
MAGQLAKNNQPTKFFQIGKIIRLLKMAKLKKIGK